MLEQQPSLNPTPVRLAPKAQYRRPLAVLLALLLLGCAWLWRRGQPLQTFTYPGEARGLTISPDGSTLAAITTSSRSGPKAEGVVLWDTRDWRPLHLLPGNVYWLWFTSDSRSLITLADDDETRSTKGVLDSMALKRGHPGWSRQQVFARMLDLDNYVVLQQWDVLTGRSVFKVALPSAASTAISHDGQWIVFENGAQTTTVWDIAGRRVQTLPVRTTVTWPALSPDKALLATGDVAHQPGQQGIWDLHTGARIKALDGQVKDVEAVCFSSDGRLFATTTKCSVSIWDAHTWRFVRALPVDYTKFVLTSRFSRDGRYLVSSGQRQDVQSNFGQFNTDFWDVTTGRRISRAQDQYLLGLSPSGRFAVTLEQDKNTGATSHNVVWKVATGQHWGQYPDTSDWAFFPGDHKLLTVTMHYDSSLNPIPVGYRQSVTSIFSLWRGLQP